MHAPFAILPIKEMQQKKFKEGHILETHTRDYKQIINNLVSENSDEKPKNTLENKNENINDNNQIIN